MPVCYGHYANVFHTEWPQKLINTVSIRGRPFNHDCNNAQTLLVKIWTLPLYLPNNSMIFTWMNFKVRFLICLKMFCGGSLQGLCFSWSVSCRLRSVYIVFTMWPPRNMYWGCDSTENYYVSDSFSIVPLVQWSESSIQKNMWCLVILYMYM